MKRTDPTPIVSCRRFAKCGDRSIYWCRKFRDKAERCQGCELIRHHVRPNVKTENGVTLRRCTVCGRFLRLNWFYPKRIIRNGKAYLTYSCECRICVSEKHKLRQSI